MSQDRPSAVELLASVREFLDALAARLEAESRFQVQVSSHLIGIVERELGLGERFDEEERARYAAFLGEDGSLRELTRALCRQIREGRHDARWDELMKLVLAETVAKVAIVRPTHLDARHRSPTTADRAGSGP